MVSSSGHGRLIPPFFGTRGARYACAAASVALALWARLLLDPVLGPSYPFPTLFFAILFSAWYGGFGPAFVAIILSVVGADYFLLPPRYSFALPDLAERVGLALYVTSGLGLALLGGAMRRAQRALLEANEGLEARVKGRSAELASANEALRVSEAMLAGIVDSAMDGIVAVDADQRIQRVNGAAEKIFGYRAADLVGGPLDRLLPERFRASHIQHLRGFSESELTRRRMDSLGSIYGLRSDGTEFPMEASISRVEVGGRRLFTTIFRDITRRLKAEAELTTSRAQLQAALLAGEMGTWFVDASSGTAHWDDVVLRLWGRTREELGSGTTEELSRFLHPDDADAIRDIAKAVEGGENLVRSEYRVVHPDGTTRWLASRGQVERDARGRPVRYAGVTMDVTDQQRAEEARQRAQKLEALGTLAGGIAHDFNNVLLAITGNAKLGLDELPAGHPVADNLREIAKAGARATDLVRRILTFGRPEAQQRRVAGLGTVVREAIQLLQATLPATIELRSAIQPGSSTALVDPSQLLQALINLGTNAAQAISGTGWIEFGLDTATGGAGSPAGAAGLAEGRCLRLWVSDSGCGMDSATQARIFDPFFTTKPLGVGTGLGLSVVHGIIKSHGGTISVDSEPGRGSRFSLYFPAVAGVEDETVTEQREARRGDGEHVLYVDDEQALVLLATRVLNRLGYTVTGANDPRRALEDFRARPSAFDVVVTDLSMPHLSGFELATQMLAVRPELPIVMTSGYVRAEDQQTAREIGIHALILKPDTIDELGAVLDRLLRKRHAPA